MAPRSMTNKNNQNTLGWSLENGYETGFTGREYPLRMTDSNRKNGLELIVSFERRLNKTFCGMMVDGFFITINSPGNSLYLTNVFYIQTSKNIRFNIEPTIFDISEGLSKYKSNQRGCFLNNERKLRFYKIYTKLNCEQECLANLTKDVCGCVKYSRPSKQILFIKRIFINFNIEFYFINSKKYSNSLNRGQKHKNLWFGTH